MNGARSAVSLRQAATAIKTEWREGAEPDAQAALSRRPELREHKAVVLDLAYEEYCVRCNTGAPPDPDVFCDRFPAFRQSLHRLILWHQFLASNIRLLAETAPTPWPEPGERFGDFLLVRLLGRGAFAHVYLALEESTGGRPVAVKLSPEGAAEARTLGRLVHPNIVPILSARREENASLTAVCMPFLGAATLTDVMDQAYPEPDAPPPVRAEVIREAIRAASCPEDPAPLTSGDGALPENGLYVEGVVRLAVQIADALAFLHKEGVCHRDLKPSNVLLSADGRALLLDFNLSADARAAVPRLGGTLPYMAPEQLRALLRSTGEDDLDARVDLFAVGVILYELLTGKHPFGASPGGQSTRDAESSLLERHRKGCTPLRTLNPAVDRRLARLIESCLAFDPAARPASAAALAAGFRRYLSLPARLYRAAARRPWLVTAAAGLLLLTAGAAAEHLATPQEPADALDYQQGRAAFFNRDYIHAGERFNQTILDYPKDPKPRKYYMARGVAMLRQAEATNDDQEAKNLLIDAAHDLNEANRQHSDGATMALLGYCSSWRRDYQQALMWFNKAGEAGFTSAGLCNDRGYCHLKLTELDEARQDIDAAIKQDPNLSAAHFNHAMLILYPQPPVDPPTSLEPVLQEMKQVVEGAQGSLHLYLGAAKLFAVAVRDPRTADRASLARQTVSYLQKAVDCGEKPQTLSEDAAFRPVLDFFPGFQFRDRSPGLPVLTPNPQLVDPAPYQPE